MFRLLKFTDNAIDAGRDRIHGGQINAVPGMWTCIVEKEIYLSFKVISPILDLWNRRPNYMTRCKSIEIIFTHEHGKRILE